MKNFFATILSLLLISILASTPLLSILIQPVSASGSNAVFCPNNYAPPPDGPDTENEIDLSTETTMYIAYWLQDYYWSGYYLYGDPFGYTAYVSPEDYSNTLDVLQTYYDCATVFTKGHCVPWGYHGDHFKLLCTYSGWWNDLQAKDSSHIYEHTNGENYLSFIWHCGTANSYPSVDYGDGQGPTGMCYAFTRDNDLLPYRSWGDHTYLGWYCTEGCPSPQFETQMYSGSSWWWANFAMMFWYGMVYWGWSVYDAIYYISYDVWNEYWMFTPLYNWLIVYGDMNAYLPNW